MLSGCCAQSGGDAQGHYSQYAQVPDVEKGGGAAKKKAPVKKKANLPPKKKGGPPGRKSVQEESEVRCFFVVLALRLWCLVVVLVARQGLPSEK